MSVWRNYWFAPSYYLDLAIVRIVAVATALVMLLYLRQWHVAYASLSDDHWQPLIILNVFHAPFGWGFRPPLEIVEVAYFTAVIAGALSLLGILTNLSLVIFTVASVYVQAFIYSFGEVHHREAVMMIALGALAISPSGRMLSIDSMIARRRGASLLEDKSEFAGWPIKLIGWFFVLMYLSAVRSKLSHAGLDWANGFTLQYALARDGLRWGNPLGLWLSQFHLPVMALQFVVLAFQSTFAVAMIFPKSRWFYVPVGLMFHIGIYLTLKAPFYQWIALYVVFVPWTAALKWLLARSARPDVSSLPPVSARGQPSQSPSNAAPPLRQSAPMGWHGSKAHCEGD
jgi:hypothetical protein